MHTFTKVALSGMVVSALALGMAVPARAATEINLVTMAGINDEDYDGGLVFKTYVENSTNGNVTVNLYPGAQLCGSSNECFEAMKAGTLNIFNGTAGGASVLYPAIQALDIPYLFKDDRVVKRVMDGPFQQEIRDRILKATDGQIMVLNIGQTGGFRGILTKNKQIKVPEDLAGLKIRTIESPIQQALVRSMGASPTPIAWADTYTAASTGVVDGALLGISDVVNAKLNETMKNLTLDRNAYMINMWMINTAKFNELSDEEKKVVIDGGLMFSNTTYGVQPRKEVDAFIDFAKTGGKVYLPTAAEQARFQQNGAPIREWYLQQTGEEGQSFLNELEKAIATAEKEIAAEDAAILKSAAGGR